MEKEIAIGIIEDLEKSLEDNGIIAQAPEIKEALTMSIEALKGEGDELKTFKVPNQEPLSNKDIKNFLGISENKGVSCISLQ